MLSLRCVSLRASSLKVLCDASFEVFFFEVFFDGVSDVHKTDLLPNIKVVCPGSKHMKSGFLSGIPCLQCSLRCSLLLSTRCFSDAFFEVICFEVFSDASLEAWPPRPYA